MSKTALAGAVVPNSNPPARTETRPESAADAIRALEPIVQTLARKYFPPPGTDHADLVQEARIGAWKAWRDFRGDAGASFWTFARMCIERQLITSVKTGTRRKHAILSGAASLDKTHGDDEGGQTLADVALLSHAADPERRTLAREHALELLETLRWDLSVMERDCFVAIELYGSTYTAAAAELGLDAKTVDNAVQRARRKLGASDLSAECDICGEHIDSPPLCAPCQDAVDFARTFVDAA